MKTHRLRWPEIADVPRDETPQPLWRRLLWMAGIWAATIGVLLLVSMLLRLVLKP